MTPVPPEVRDEVRRVLAEVAAERGRDLDEVASAPDIIAMSCRALAARSLVRSGMSVEAVAAGMGYAPKTVVALLRRAEAMREGPSESVRAAHRGTARHPLWLVWEGDAPLALVAAASSSAAVDLARGDHAEEVGAAWTGGARIVRRLGARDAPARAGSATTGSSSFARRLLQEAARALGISLREAQSRRTPAAIAARWATWAVLVDRHGWTASAAGAASGHDHSTVSVALPITRRRLEDGGDERLTRAHAAIASIALPPLRPPTTDVRAGMLG